MRVLGPIGLTVAATLTTSIASSALASGPSSYISEIRISQTGPDTDRYVEITGVPGESLDTLTMVVIGDVEDAFPPEQNGGIDMAVSLAGLSIPDDGVLLIAEDTYSQGTPDATATLNFESADNLTVMLVDNFTGAVDDDLDTDNDGTLDITPWSAILSSMAILIDANPNGFSAEYYYSDDTVGPIAGYTPLHAWQCADTGAWRPGSDDIGGFNESPGDANPNCDGGGGGNDDMLISELRVDQSSSDVDEFFEICGIPGTSLTGLHYIVLGDGSAGDSGFIEAIVDLTGQEIPGSGYFVVAEDTFTLGVADMIANLNFENSDNVTHMLVSGFIDTVTDVDTDDDGVIDTPAWDTIIDSVALLETCEQPPTGTEWAYGDEFVLPNGTYVAGGAWRCTPTNDWVIGDYYDTSIGHSPGLPNPPCDESGAGCGGLNRSCYATNSGPGCSDGIICNLVCQADPGCCQEGAN
ncbi:MAG: hypothetical protein MK085_03755, partial [Phycisphaerales bacterium]|nr:hypothetical protein [Phycisphaerales bacterium]